MVQFRRMLALGLAAATVFGSLTAGYAEEIEETEPSEVIVEEQEELAEEEWLTEEVEAEPDLLGLPGMPEGFVLSEAQYAEKCSLQAHGVRQALEELTEGVDYAAQTVFFAADSLEYAQTVAAAYDAELTDWAYGIATIRLNSISVLEALRLAEDPDVPLPAVNADVYVTVEPIEDGRNNAMQALSLVPEAPNWSLWIHELMEQPDPYLTNPADSTFQWHHDVIHTYEAWGVTMGNPAIRVAVIDTGVENRNADLTHVTLETVVGSTVPSSGHGSHVAGIIGAEADNGLFGAGIAPGVSLISIRASQSGTSFAYSSVSKAIQFAIDLGANLINLSLGGSSYSSVLAEKLELAYQKGITVIGSVGNNDTNIRMYPSSLDTVIAVAASDMAGARAHFGSDSGSNYGSHVDIAAPGYCIPSTYDVFGTVLSGTSMAAPMVTGAAALYMSRMLEKTGQVPAPDAVRAALLRAVNPAASSGMGAGILDVSKLFAQTKTAPVITVLDENGEAVAGTVKTVTADGSLTIHQPDGSYMQILYTLDGTTPAIKNGEVVHGVMYTGPISLKDLEPGSYPVRAASVNGMGGLSSVAKLTLKILPGAYPEEILLTAPDSLIAGRSVTLSAQVLPASVSQEVRWEWETNLTGVSISKTGNLTTLPGQTGLVKVRAVSGVDSSVYCEQVIHIVQGTPAASVELNAKTKTLRVYADSAEPFQLTPVFRDGSRQTLDAQTVAHTFVSGNPKIASVTAQGVVTAKAPGTVTITCRALDGSGKTAVCKITVKAGVEDLEVKGQTSIAPGTSATFSVATLPQYISGKTVTWYLQDAPEGVTLRKSTVSVSKNAQLGGAFTVCAEVSDGFRAVTHQHRVEIAPKASAVHISLADNQKPVEMTQTKSGWLSSVTIYATPYQGNHPDWVALNGELTNTWTAPAWSSSKPAVATVDEDGIVRGIRPGTAKIYCKAQDGSGKTASVTVKVIMPASDITLESGAAMVNKQNLRFLGYGKSVSHTVVLGQTYGVPTVKKVNWSLKARANGVDVTTLLLSRKLVSLTTGGKLTVKSGARTAVSGELYLTVYAETTDGTNLRGELNYVVGPVATVLTVTPNGRTLELQQEKSASVFVTMDNPYALYRVESSASEIAGAVLKWDGAEGKYRVDIQAGRKTGTSRITIAAADGGGKKVTLTVRVSG